MTSRGGEKVLSLKFNQDHSKCLNLFDLSCNPLSQFVAAFCAGCFTCCTDAGIRIHNVEPLTEKAHYGIVKNTTLCLSLLKFKNNSFFDLDTSEMGTVIHCEMLHRTNLIAVVGGGPRPKFADNTILIYDDVLKKFVLDYTFTQPVVAVCLKRDRY